MSTPGALNRTTDATLDPVTLNEAKRHVNVEFNRDDNLITALITAAREHAEEYTGRAFNTQTWTLELDAWPADGVIRLARSPTISVSTVKYYNSAGVQTTLVSGTDYQEALTSEPARITIEPGMTWPTVETGRLNAVEVIYVAGYGALASDVPQAIRQAMLLAIAAWYEHREELTDLALRRLPFGARALLWQKRLLSA